MIKEFIENFAEQVEVEDIELLEPGTPFRSLEEWSSLGGFMMMGFIKDTFGKEVTASDIRACETIEDLYKLAIS